MKFLYNIRSFFNNIAYWSDSYYKLLVFFFFAAYFFIGYFAYNDYGISWDEDISRKNGLVSVAYIIKKIKPELIADKPVILNMTDLHSWQDKDYGVVFEVPLVILENLFGLENNHSPKLYYLRHFCTFLFFFLGVLHLFLLLNYRFGNWRIGLLGCLLLILSPRIFADSFYNDKDIVLLSAFIITSYYLLQYLSNKSIQTSFWLGFFML